MTLAELRNRLLLQEDINFLLTNRVPRHALTLFMGWFSKIRHPWVCKASIGVWRLFADLDLSDAKKQQFESLHDCFTRELKPGARSVDMDTQNLASPCDGIVGACGTVVAGQVLQAKGFAYRTDDLFGRDAAHLCARVWISDLHPGHAGLPGGGPAGHSCAAWTARPSTWWATSSTAGNCADLVLAAGHNDVVQKILRKARKGTRVVFVPGNHDEFARVPRGTTSAASTWWRTASTRPPTAAAVGHPRRPVRRRDPVRQVAGLPGRLRPTNFTLKLNRHLNSLRGAAGAALLEPVALPQAQGQAGRQLRGRLRAAVAREARRAAPTAWSAGTSTMPRCEDRRRALLQRRRLGRKPHRAGRAPRRAAGDHRLGGAFGHRADCGDTAGGFAALGEFSPR
jgi:phosphatidylserine decarboxylase